MSRCSRTCTTRSRTPTSSCTACVTPSRPGPGWGSSTTTSRPSATARRRSACAASWPPSATGKSGFSPWSPPTATWRSSRRRTRCLLSAPSSRARSDESESPAQDLGHRGGGEPELEQGHSGVEVLPVTGDLAVRQLEDTHAGEADLAAGAPRHRVADRVAERPLGRDATGVAHHHVHRPVIVAALVEHALEHGAELGLPRVRSVEVVDVGGALREAGEEGGHVLAIEGGGEIMNDGHGDLPQSHRRRATPRMSISKARSLTGGWLRCQVTP